MSKIKQHIENKANQRLAAARQLDLECAGGVSEFTARFAAMLNVLNAQSDLDHEASLAQSGKVLRWAKSGSIPAQRHFSSLMLSENLVLLTFGTSADFYRRKGLSTASRAWVAHLSISTANNPARLEASTSLQKWIVDGNGFIWNGRSYFDFVTRLLSEFNGSYLDDPLDEADSRFVELA